MRVVSFYTENGSYPELAERLKASCDKFGLPHHIQRFEKATDWTRVCNSKPLFLLQCLMQFRSPVLWVDVDCEFLKLPTIFWRAAHDFAIYNWSADPLNTEYFNQVQEHPATSSGVTYVGYTAPAMELMVRWVDACAENPGIVDDQVLDKVWKVSRPPVNEMWLPRTANWLVGTFGPPTPEVIIRHDYAGKAVWNDGRWADTRTNLVKGKA